MVCDSKDGVSCSQAMDAHSWYTCIGKKISGRLTRVRSKDRLDVQTSIIEEKAHSHRIELQSGKVTQTAARIHGRRPSTHQT